MGAGSLDVTDDHSRAFSDSTISDNWEGDQTRSVLLSLFLLGLL